MGQGPQLKGGLQTCGIRLQNHRIAIQIHTPGIPESHAGAASWLQRAASLHLFDCRQLTSAMYDILDGYQTETTIAMSSLYTSWLMLMASIVHCWTSISNVVA
ncbi:hypothetical protein CVIRNUC_006358 [Coccomyxa viridis]|uniref:Uncharacterized protein n=1 Tax=Coccomyxa viridis TaxID=1274662 RepID=A0AAV1I7W2_9CHLO|nr:hypothetical protein CVIRNUC_006358 [Coccomyxa viridis]